MAAIDGIQQPIAFDLLAYWILEFGKNKVNVLWR